jgi:hypothetical protein
MPDAPAPVHIAGVSKTTYVPATSRCLDWRRDLQRTSTSGSRTRSTVPISMAAVIAAIIGAVCDRSLAASSSSAPSLDVRLAGHDGGPKCGCRRRH